MKNCCLVSTESNQKTSGYCQYEINRSPQNDHLKDKGVYVRVPTSSGNHGIPGKSQKKVTCMEKSWNLKNLNNHGKIMDFCEII